MFLFLVALFLSSMSFLSLLTASEAFDREWGTPAEDRAEAVCGVGIHLYHVIVKMDSNPIP